MVSPVDETGHSERPDFGQKFSCLSPHRAHCGRSESVLERIRITFCELAYGVHEQELWIPITGESM